MISQRTIISGCAEKIFAIFSPNGSVLGADDRSGPHFSDISRDVAMATNFVKISLSGIPKRRRSGYTLGFFANTYKRVGLHIINTGIYNAQSGRAQRLESEITRNAWQSLAYSPFGAACRPLAGSSET